MSIEKPVKVRAFFRSLAMVVGFTLAFVIYIGACVVTHGLVLLVTFVLSVFGMAVFLVYQAHINKIKAERRAALMREARERGARPRF